jgi:hypothetical protein
MGMCLCDNGGAAARKYSDLGGAVNGPARRRRSKFFHLAVEWQAL